MSKARMLLEESAPFKQFDQAILDLFLETAHERSYAPGEIVFSELETGDEVFFILEGQVRVAVEFASAYHMIEEIECGVGELIGESRFLSDEPRSKTVTAITDAKTLVWHVEDWRRIAEEHPVVGYRLAMFSSQVLIKRSSELKQHLMSDVAWGIE